MLKKTLTMLLVVLLVNLSLVPSTFANTKETTKEQKFVAKLKTNVQSQGIGVNSKIKLKLKDGTKLNGYISEINDDGIVVVNEKDGQSVAVPYPQVKQAKGNNWSAKEWIGIGIAIGVFVILLVAVARDKS